MAQCPIKLNEYIQGEDALGHFYLYSAPGAYDGTLNISSGGPFSVFSIAPFIVNPATSLIPGGYEAIVDLSNEAPGQYIFRYVTPATFEGNATTPADCDVCVDCEDIIINKVASIEDQEFNFCTNDPDLYNIFTLAGVSSSQYNIDYKEGSQEDLDFDLVFGSSGYGNFRPIEITSGTYTFVLTNVTDGECESCSFEVVLIFTEPAPAGEDGEGVICIGQTCTVSLWDMVGEPRTEGGNWFYTGGPNPLTINYGTCPSVASSDSFALNDQIGTGHDICISVVWSEELEFTYVYPAEGELAGCGFDCIECATVTITPIEVPADVEVEICTSDEEINLYDLLPEGTYGVGNWTKTSGAGVWTNGKSNDNDGTNDFIVPSDFVPGVYVFTYTIDSICEGCEVEVEITILPTADSGGSEEILICG